MGRLRRAFLAAATVWPIALLLAAAAAARPQLATIGYPFAVAVYAAGSLICHQRPERSFHLLGVQLPVCARCLGVYAGAALVAAIVAATPGRSPSPPTLGNPRRAAAGGGGPAPRTILLISVLPTAATLVVEWGTGDTPGNWTRALSGAPLGAAVAWIVGGVR